MYKNTFDLCITSMFIYLFFSAVRDWRTSGSFHHQNPSWSDAQTLQHWFRCRKRFNDVTQHKLSTGTGNIFSWLGKWIRMAKWFTGKKVTKRQVGLNWLAVKLRHTTVTRSYLFIQKKYGEWKPNHKTASKTGVFN